jgi:hypothetical protein
LAPAIFVAGRVCQGVPKLFTGNDIHSPMLPRFVVSTLPTVVLLQQRCWVIGSAAPSLVPNERTPLTEASFRALKDGHQRGGTSVHTIER